jgi:UDP-N-acetylmuramate dehydrogenase
VERQGYRIGGAAERLLRGVVGSEEEQAGLYVLRDGDGGADGERTGRAVMAESELESLAEALGPRVHRDVSLAVFTSMRVGGPADLLIVAENVAEISRAVQLAREREIPCRVLGGGSNVLIADRGLRGLVIINRAASTSFDVGTVRAESGAKLSVLARSAVDAGLAGLAWAVGLPGTVGGALVGNAGAFGGDIASVLSSASLLNPNGDVVERAAKWFEFTYRGSRLKRNAKRRTREAIGTLGPVALEVEFQLQPGDVEALKSRADEVIQKRRAGQPCGPTMGSTFKNPPDDYAARLIEEVGLKGYRVGGARISQQHANFIVNLGDATAVEVLALIEHAQAQVERLCGVSLEPEIELLGW